MNASAATRPPTPRRAPATAEEFLEREEALALQRLTSVVQRAADELCPASELRPLIRRHPFLATGLGAFLGFVSGPHMLRVLAKIARVTSGSVLLRVIRG